MSQPTPEKEVEMLITDCMEYALKAQGHSGEVRWKPTTDVRIWVIRLRHLKDALIRLNGREPLGWNKDDPFVE